MRDLLRQLAALLGAGFAAACCLGLPLALSALGVLGLSRMPDAWLYPPFVAFIAFTLWLLWRSTGRHGQRAPLWLALAGGGLASLALWGTMTGLAPATGPLYLGIGALLAGSLWDFVLARRQPGCAAACAPRAPVDPARRAVNGAAVAVAAAGAWYGLYRSVAAFAPSAETGQIACWGVNRCKGQTACSTAFNACTGQNACRGKGWLYLSPDECAARGGRPLAGSPGDPARG